MKDYSKTVLTLAHSPIRLYATLYQAEKDNFYYKGVLLYFHGGGLIFGLREDLPDMHIRTFLEHGYAIIAFDYRLGPASEIRDMMDDVTFSINWYLKNQAALFGHVLPYYLFGRSAGAYLCLLAGQKPFTPAPSGILSYYGYAFLEDGWYQYPSPYYQKINPGDTTQLYETAHNRICTASPPQQRYALYAEARRKGNWISYFHKGREKDFYLNYTFKNHNSFAQYPPVFLVHCLLDQDVPYMESKKLSELLPQTRLHTVAGSLHNFDEQGGRVTAEVLKKSCVFLNATNTTYQSVF